MRLLLCANWERDIAMASEVYDDREQMEGERELPGMGQVWGLRGGS